MDCITPLRRTTAPLSPKEAITLNHYPTLRVMRANVLLREERMHIQMIDGGRVTSFANEAVSVRGSEHRRRHGC